MGVLKNDVGRPSNKTIRTRFILKLIGLILVVGLAFVVGYMLSNTETKELEKEVVKEDSKKIAEKIYSYYSDFTFVPRLDEFYPEDKVIKSDIGIDNMFTIAASNTKTQNCKGNYEYAEKDCLDADELKKTVNKLFGKNITITEETSFGLNCDGYEYSKENNEFYHWGAIGTIKEFVKKMYDYELKNNKLYIYEVVAVNDVEGITYDANGVYSYKTNELITKDNIINKKDSLDKFKWIFTKNKDGNYVFESIEKIKETKEYTVASAFDKFVKNNRLITYTKDEIHHEGDIAKYDVKSLQAINCTTATMAVPDSSVDYYYAEIYTFTSETFAKKEFEEQKKYQKTAGDDVIQVFDRKILNDKSTSNYDMFEISYITEDIEGSDSKVYSYYYSLRIDNYIITIYNRDYDNHNEKTVLKLKDELNTLLDIK